MHVLFAPAGKRILPLLGLLIAVSLAAGLCRPAPAPTPAPPGAPVSLEDEWGVVSVAPGSRITIGAAAAISGDVAPFGQDIMAGYDLAAADFGDIKGFQVQLAKEDSGCTGEGGTAVGNKFAANPQVFAVAGHMCSSSCIPASDIYQQARIVMISPSCTAVAFTARGLEITFRTAWNDSVQGKAAAEHAYNTVGARAAALIHDGSPYGQGLVDVFRARWEELGGTVTSYEGITVGEQDFRAVLTKVAAEGPPDLIYFGGFIAEGALLVQQKNEVGLEETVFFGADGIAATAYIEAAAGAAEGSYASSAEPVVADTPELQAFRAKYQELTGAEYGELGPFGAYAYDAMTIILTAVRETSVVDHNGNLLIGRKAVRDWIAGLTNFRGLTGTLSCDAAGDCASGAQVLFTQVQEGEFVPVTAPAAAQRSLIRSVEALDELTVRITLNRPDVAFPQKIAFDVFSIHSPTAMERAVPGGEYGRSPVGTGPYSFVEWRANESITLQRFDGYWGDPAREPTLVFRVIQEPTARTAELQAGTVDAIDNPTPDDIATLEADANITVYFRPPFNVGYVGLNNTIQPFDDVRVRQAVAHAINRQAIVDNLYVGAEVAEQFVPRGIFGHTEGLGFYEYDPERARQLLAEAGYADGFETSLWVMPLSRGYYPTPDRVGAAVQADLAAVGIQAEIVTMEWGTYLDEIDAGRAPMFLLGWMADYPDATNFLDVFFTGADDSFGQPYPELIELLNRAASLSDAAEREPLYDQANEFIRDQVIAIPMVYNPRPFAARNTLGGVQPAPLNDDWQVVEDTVDDTLIVGRSGDSVTLDCADVTDGESIMVCHMIAEPLLRYEIGGSEVVPALAQRWEVSDDLTTYTFYLRPEVKFHDGTDLNAEAVVTNVERWWDPNHPLRDRAPTAAYDYFAYFFGGFKGE